ncbi:MAG: 1,2-phenylacetyl-CoA epoxidase subunit PaaD [Hydrogenophaga sp.]|uniref:1,2-phenylacetyl-CoA epoxidase subunit PaaD n=1 Tax=Hydrogenophaga sp. TaxID=1904254 RepID=UPI00278E6589|nr:1,2-phenylacetyl-CoA epoxidase subunit PaaD [Hydrogenophaga sp.]MDP3133083.1 1,2-phenylacetyl-CoA epoxidase subunit PaaD [Burkholderiaceae bacterium]MDZ4190124.1 1,2-phenylacetyl-CoA epoxidase subunit PaaD [Hydrogenophaga sp.]
MSALASATAQAATQPPGVPTDPVLAQVWALLDDVADPEIPVVSLKDLGILRDVRHGTDGVEVVITPTYSGCPAMGQMADDVAAALASHGIAGRVVTQLSPAWTTDWIGPTAREKLRAYGIAPPHSTAQAGHCRSAARVAGAPGETAQERVLRFMPQASAARPAVPCPHCGSTHTVESSHFGSTACKALYKCLSCQEPFDFFKPY